jgi:hypothetical protein
MHGLARVAEREHEVGDAEAARKLAEELGFLPLASEQAASFLTKEAAGQRPKTLHRLR